MPSRRRAFLILASLCLLALASFGLALMVGSFKVAPADVLATLPGMADRVIRLDEARRPVAK